MTETTKKITITEKLFEICERGPDDYDSNGDGNNWQEAALEDLKAAVAALPVGGEVDLMNARDIEQNTLLSFTCGVHDNLAITKYLLDQGLDPYFSFSLSDPSSSVFDHF